MHDWTPKDYFSGSMTTDQPPPTTVYRQYWEDKWNNARGNVYLNNAINRCKFGDCKTTPAAEQSFVNEPNLGLTANHSSKRRKTGISDPRFKRLINPEVGNDVCPRNNVKKPADIASVTDTLEGRVEEKILTDKMISYLKPPVEASALSCSNLKIKVEKEGETRRRDFFSPPAEDEDFEASAKCFSECEASERLNSRHPLTLSPRFHCFENLKKKKVTSAENLRRSVSDCALEAKTLLGDENDEESTRRLKPCPSATRLNKVHNWMRDYKLPAEKRRSVITVIGQTQTKSFSKILNEINERKKLAKELDKRALCKALVESVEDNSDVKNLVAKVDFVLPDGKILYSTKKIYLCKKNSKYKVDKRNENCPRQNTDRLVDGNGNPSKKRQMIPERDSPTNHIRRRSRMKHATRKSEKQVKEKFHLRDNETSCYGRISNVCIWPFLALLCLTMFACALYYRIRSANSFIFPEFLKPRSRSWYKRLPF